MVETTVELDTKQEESASPNGHDATWKSFDDDQTFLQHILSKKPAEELIEVPEWEVKILCRALNAEHRVKVQMAAYDAKTKLSDYRKCFTLVAMGGSYNPVTGNRAFSEKDRDFLEQHGGVVEKLAVTILRLSRMLADDAERAKKN